MPRPPHVTASAAELLAPRLEQRIIPGLDRVQRALESFENPHERFASVLVVGTNGKGATAALLASILCAHGVRVGLYTSPHLVRVEERIRVDGRTIDPADLARLVGELDRHPELSYFEALTVSALRHFAATGVRVAVLEAGLGGRWDAVNAVRPVVSLLTNVGTDHQAWLGPTRGHIAAEKAAALRGREAVVGGWDAEVEPVIRAHAEAPLSMAANWAHVETGAQVSARVLTIAFDAVLPLAGIHQLDNLRLALAGAAALAKHGVAPPLEREALIRGIEGVRWPGRLQWVEHEGRRLLLDGAHNREAALALAAALDQMGLSENIDLLFSCLHDKPLAEMAALLAPRVGRVTVVPLDSPRAVPAGVLAAAFPGAAVAADVAAALASCGRSRPTLVTGSLYLVGEVLRLTGGMDG
ncbi:MAG: bifunctional folylpolyglutamate synthase/dihydrofolate synthase [Thermoanaerobaculaceae bacterium]